MPANASTGFHSNSTEQAPIATDGALDLAVVVPSLNDCEQLRRLLPMLRGLSLSVVVSDGGSTDSSVEFALAQDVQLVLGAASRGEQLARGVAATSSAWLLFLHCDSELSELAVSQLASIIARGEPAWGRFDIRLVPATPGLGCIGWFMNRRSRLFKMCTGDQGIFVHRSLLEKIGGVPCQPLMEDIELSKRLRATRARFYPLAGPLFSSARRWQANGLVATVLSMWRFRIAYWFGVSPQQLARSYYPKNGAR